MPYKLAQSFQFAIRRFHLLILLIALPFLTSCMLMRLDKNLRQLEELSELSGSVTYEGRAENLVVVLARVDGSAPIVVNYKVMEKPGDFSFYPPAGTYRLLAYIDTNSDFRLQHFERAVRTEQIKTTVGEIVNEILLHIPRRTSKELRKSIISNRSKIQRQLPQHKASLAKVFSIDDPVFSRFNASLGMWEPYRFLREIPNGIFFLQAYQKRKTPVLLVHGIGDTPASFTDLVSSIDRDKFQPWIAFYPSGLRLQPIVNFLDEQLDELHARFRFSKMNVVAHSMGGLISRGIILKSVADKASYRVEKFVTLSTPWDGHAGAKVGVRTAPVVMPVWHDMSPGSSFLTSLFDTPLPKKVKTYLLFGFKGGGGLFQDNNDGTVTLASQLKLQAQQEARQVRGFNVRHTEILSNKDSLSFLNNVLAE